MVQKNQTNIWGVDVDDIVISKLVEIKTKSNFLISYLDKVIGSLVLVLPKWVDMLYVKTLKVKDGDEDENNKLISFLIDDEKLSKTYQ